MMPLAKGSSEAVIASNVKELIAAGHSQEQAVAIAEAEARRSQDEEATEFAIRAKKAKDTKRIRVTVSDRMGIFAPTPLGKSRAITPEGYLLCKDVAIARIGTQTYGEHEFDHGDGEEPLKGNADGQIIVERLPEEVFRDETVASFEGKPITVEHPNQFVTPDTWKDETVGLVQNVHRGSGIENDFLLADLLVTAADAIVYVNRDMPELSCGYTSEYEQIEPGRAIQRNIIGNHVALVDRGRAGPRCAIKDHQPEELMSTPKSKFARSLVRVLTAFQTKDAKELENELEKIEDEEPEETKKDKESKDELGSRLKAAEDWIRDRKARDEAEAKTKDEEEKKAKEEQEAKDKKARDEVLNAEVLPKLVNLGKVYTGDSANDAPVKELFSRAEILAPGIAIPTTDALKTANDALPALMLKALQTADASDAGKDCVKPFLMGRDIRALTGDALLGVFNGAAELMRQRNNRAADPGKVTMHEFSKPVTPASINEANRKFWKDRAAQV